MNDAAQPLIRLDKVTKIFGLFAGGGEILR